MTALYKFSIILLFLSSCEHKNNISDQTLNTNDPIHSVSIDSIKYSDYVNSLPISQLPDGYTEILNKHEYPINDEQKSYQKISTIQNKRYQKKYTGAQTYDICLCTPNDTYEVNDYKYTIFKRLKPINDSIETLLLLRDNSGKIDIITINKYDEKIIDSLNISDSYQGDFSIFKLFYIDKDYKITLKSFWSYEDDGHPSPHERSKCEYKINPNGKIVSYFQKPDGFIEVKLETTEAGQSMYQTLFSGEIKNHLKNGKWVEKRMTNTFLHADSGEYVDGIKKGKWIYNQYSSNKIDVTIDSDLNELTVFISDTIIY